MAILDFYDGLTARLRSAGDWVWPTALRIILWWEFWEAGVKKYAIATKKPKAQG